MLLREPAPPGSRVINIPNVTPRLSKSKPIFRPKLLKNHNLYSSRLHIAIYTAHIREYLLGYSLVCICVTTFFLPPSIFPSSFILSFMTVKIISDHPKCEAQVAGLGGHLLTRAQTTLDKYHSSLAYGNWQDLTHFDFK